jgi:glycosyltransferase involved in cell wall biosynthesis
MRILIVNPTLPVPTSGARTRIYNLIRQLAQRHEVSVLSFAFPHDERLADELRPLLQELTTVPLAPFTPKGVWRNRIEGWAEILFARRPRYARTFPIGRLRLPLQQMVARDRPEVILFDQLFVAELAQATAGMPMVLAAHNVESEIAGQAVRQATTLVHRLRDWLDWRKLKGFEERWLLRFRVITAVSEEDARILRRMAPGAELFVAPNGADTMAFAPPVDCREQGRLLFFGTLNYGPNADGIIWFCRQVLPGIRARRPDVTLEIIGLDPPERVLALHDPPRVVVIGPVDDVRPHLWRATATVVPLLLGGGTRLKVVEALAAGCPVISTTVGAAGLAVADGRDLLLADGAEEFVEAGLRVIGDPLLASRLGQAGMEAARRYDWSRVAPVLEAALCRAISLHQGAAPPA